MRKREKTPKGAYSGDAEHRLPTRSCNSWEPEASPLCVGLLPRLSGSSAPFQFRFQLPDAGFGRVGTGFGGTSCLGISDAGLVRLVEGQQVTLRCGVPPAQPAVFPAEVQAQRVAVPVEVSRANLLYPGRLVRSFHQQVADQGCIVCCPPDGSKRQYSGMPKAA